MARHKKTRQEKIIADYRHSVYTLKDKNIHTVNPTITTATINTSSYSYVIGDISKTGLITFSIITIELILFFLLKNHIISLPNITY